MDGSSDAPPVPVIDFSSYDTPDKSAVSHEICQVLRTIGFLNLTNHGIPEQLVNDVFEESRKFFTLPLEEKLKFLRTNGHETLTGYNRINQERLDPSVRLELREAFDLAPFDIPTIASAPGFIPSLQRLDVECRALTLKVLHCLGIGLGLSDDHFFVKCHQAVGDISLERESGNNLRSLYYPPCTLPDSQNGNPDEVVRCGTHTDYGTVTLLFQDDVGGLEIESLVKDVFVPATPVPGAVLINIGDLLQHWTSDEFRAARHRVLLNDASKCVKARQSIAMFINPDGDTVIESLKGTKKYAPVLSRDYIISRYAAAY